MRYAVAFVLVLGLAGCQCRLDRPVHVDLTIELEKVRAARGLPALGASVWRGRRLIAAGMTGVRKADDLTHRATMADRWHLGSDTKAMTATLIGIFVDRGTLKWDDTIAKLFPGATIHPGYASVTLDQLLAHRGGAPGTAPSDLWSDLRAAGAAPTARADFVAALLARAPTEIVGRYVYSNAGYMIAGAALERATGKPWDQLMRQELFTPLGMTSCGFGAPGDAALIDEPWGHRADNLPVTPALPVADNPPGLGPAGTVHCNLADWGRFLAIHASGKSAVVSAATLAHLHTAAPGDGRRYGGGWIIVDAGDGETRLVHEGSNTMWRAIAIVAPARNLAIAVVANKNDDELYDAILPIMAPYLQPAP